MRTLEKAEKELAKGNLWRAKEILQGAIPQAGYNFELFEKLGEVLLAMGDLPEAGKFLFLSGKREPEYEESINIFLHKVRKNKPHDLFRAFPRKARLMTLSEYPVDVAQKLRELGFPEILKDERGRVTVADESGSDAVFLVACLVIVLIVLGLIVMGLIKLKEMIF